MRKSSSYRDSNSRLNVSEGYEVTNQSGSMALLSYIITILLTIVLQRLTRYLIILHYFLFFSDRKNPSYRDSNSRLNLSEGYEVTNQYGSMALLSCIITILLTMYYSVLCFVMFDGSAW